MAGIYGILGGADAAELAAMGERLRHRGATARIWSPAPDLHLGLRSSSESSLDRAVENDVLFDGLLDNTNALLELLGISAGERGRPCDASIVRHVFERFGINGFAHLAGHFALALWDKAQRRLVLARDRFGARPLCYSTADGRFVFASEYKALLAVPSVPARPNRDAIQYLQCAKFVAPQSGWE